MQNSADRKTFVIVEQMFEETQTARVAIEHQVFTNETRGVGKTLGKLLVGGEQEQARCLRAVRADYDGLGPLQMRVLLVVEIDSAGDVARTVHFEAINVGIRANFTAPGTLGNRDNTRKGAGLCADFATETITKATVDTSAASGTRLRKNCHWRGKGIPAEFASSAFENDARGFHRERRHGVGLYARR